MKSTYKLLELLKPTVERFPLVAAVYRGARDAYLHEKYAPRVAQTPLGYQFIGERIEMYTCTWEPDEVSLFLKLMDSSDLVINIGANAGYYCCLALNHGKRVLAFEPLKSNLNYLYQNIYLNGWSEQIEIYPVALSDSNGLLEMYGMGMIASSVKGWGGNKDAAPNLVPAFRFDTLIGTRTNGQRLLVLVDIEGAEYRFLQGAACLLNQNPKPIWIIEIQSNAWQPEGIQMNPYLLDTFRLFWQAGYEAFAANNLLRRFDENSIWANARMTDSTKQVTNFVFVEAGWLEHEWETK